MTTSSASNAQQRTKVVYILHIRAPKGRAYELANEAHYSNIRQHLTSGVYRRLIRPACMQRRKLVHVSSLERSFLPRVPELSTTWGLPGVRLPTKGSRERNSGGGVNQYAVSLLLATTSLAVMDIGRSRNTAIKPRYRGALETTGRPVCEFRQLPVCASARTRTGTSTRRTI